MKLDTPINARVLAYLNDKSAHSDIASVLRSSVQPLGDVQVFSPDPAGYRYVLVSTAGVVFGFAIGMDTIAFRLDDRMKERALVTGGVPCPECGAEWIAVVHHRPDDDWPKVDVSFWARKAYVCARESLSSGR
jgi:hypothetical protein